MEAITNWFSKENITSFVFNYLALWPVPVPYLIARDKEEESLYLKPFRKHFGAADVYAYTSFGGLYDPATEDGEALSKKLDRDMLNIYWIISGFCNEKIERINVHLQSPLGRGGRPLVIVKPVFSISTTDDGIIHWTMLLSCKVEIVFDEKEAGAAINKK